MEKGIVVRGEMNLSAIEIQAQVNLVQEVMKQVMKEGVHYGKPFSSSEKKTLLKPGAEKICMTFRIAPEYDIEDLSTSDEIRYRIKCKGVHIPSGADLGYGVGECSSSEEKYKWRSSVCDEEYDSYPVDKKRVKYKKSYGKVTEVKQVRTEIADIANTVLKMSKKRALVDMVLTVTATSDIFDQDIEDLPEHFIQEENAQEPMPTEKKKAPVKKVEAVEGVEEVTFGKDLTVAEKAYLLISEISESINSTEEEIVKKCSVFLNREKKEIFASSIEKLASRSSDKWLLTTYGKIKAMHEELGLAK